MDELKKLWNEKPIETMAAVAAVGIAASKVIDSIFGAKSKLAYAKAQNRKNRRK